MTKPTVEEIDAVLIAVDAEAEYIDMELGRDIDFFVGSNSECLRRSHLNTIKKAIEFHRRALGVKPRDKTDADIVLPWSGNLSDYYTYGFNDCLKQLGLIGD